MAPLAIRLGGVAFTTFLSIILWSRTRDPAWMLVVIGVIAGYADILYSILKEFGLVPPGVPAWLGAALPDLIIPVLPWFFFSLAFFLMLTRKHH